jgi:hypothetical protein
MLLVILQILVYTGSVDYGFLTISDIATYYQKILWAGFFLAFAIKTPLWPFTGWLFRAHVEAPLSGSVILAAVILKLATYAYVRILITYLSEASNYYSPLLQGICIATLIYASVAALRTHDSKALVALSSVSHCAVIVLGLFSNSLIGIEGSLLIGLSHGWVSPALFIIVGGVIYVRTHDRTIAFIRGLTNYMPLLSVLFLVFALANASIPLTASWVGEQMTLIGVFSISPFLSALGALSIFLTACYSINLYNRMMLGANSPNLKPFVDLDRREFILLISLLIPTVIFGLIPNGILENLHLSTSNLISDLGDINPLSGFDVFALNTSLEGASFSSATAAIQPALTTSEAGVDPASSDLNTVNAINLAVVPNLNIEGPELLGWYFGWWGWEDLKQRYGYTRQTIIDDDAYGLIRGWANLKYKVRRVRYLTIQDLKYQYWYLRPRRDDWEDLKWNAWKLKRAIKNSQATQNTLAFKRKVQALTWNDVVIAAKTTREDLILRHKRWQELTWLEVRKMIIRRQDKWEDRCRITLSDGGYAWEAPHKLMHPTWHLALSRKNNHYYWHWAGKQEPYPGWQDPNDFRGWLVFGHEFRLFSVFVSDSKEALRNLWMDATLVTGYQAWKFNRNADFLRKLLNSYNCTMRQFKWGRRWQVVKMKRREKALKDMRENGRPLFNTDIEHWVAVREHEELVKNSVMRLRILDREIKDTTRTRNKCMKWITDQYSEEIMVKNWQYRYTWFWEDPRWGGLFLWEIPIQVPRYGSVDWTKSMPDQIPRKFKWGSDWSNVNNWEKDWSMKDILDWDWKKPIRMFAMFTLSPLSSLFSNFAFFTVIRTLFFSTLVAILGLIFGQTLHITIFTTIWGLAGWFGVTVPTAFISATIVFLITTLIQLFFYYTKSGSQIINKWPKFQNKFIIFTNLKYNRFLRSMLSFAIISILKNLYLLLSFEFLTLVEIYRDFLYSYISTCNLFIIPESQFRLLNCILITLPNLNFDEIFSVSRSSFCHFYVHESYFANITLASQPGVVDLAYSSLRKHFIF